MAGSRQTPDVVEIAQALIRCKSVTPDEGGALGVLESHLSALGFTCHRVTFSGPDTPDVENLYARIGDQAPNLVFAGHTDVVPVGDDAAWTHPPFAAEIHDGILYGRGAVDMKGGVAAFTAAAARYLAETGGAFPGSLSFLITGDEEGPAINGTAKLLAWAAARGETFDHCIVGEPTCIEALGDMIKVGRRGSFSGTIQVRGQQGHVAYPHLAKNPLPAAARMVDTLTFGPLDQGTEHFEPSNLEIVNLDCSNPAWNVIPGRVDLRFNIRFNDTWNPGKLEAWIRDKVKICSDETGFYMALQLEPFVSDVFLTKPGKILDILTDAVHSVTGLRPERSTGGGTSDARFIKDYCPVIEFGHLNRTIHQVDEHVLLADLRSLSEIYYRLIAGYFATDKD
jgi:succinyl-diaminopimelate desuccinylase